MSNGRLCPPASRWHEYADGAGGARLVGCGYVADFYAVAVRDACPEAEVVGAVDLDAERAASFVDAYGGVRRDDLTELLDDARVEVVINLTPAETHLEVSTAALLAGRHVFSEKPLACSPARGRELVDLAVERGLALGCAPSIVGTVVARTLRSLIRDGSLGTISHIYGELDDGPLHRMQPELWRSARGLPWPYRSEFAEGPVLHHLPYAVGWAIALAGRAVEVVGMTRTAAEPTKLGVTAGPDFCVAVLRHESDCTSRLTVGALAPRGRRLTVVGTKRTAVVPDMWATDGPVFVDDERVLEPGPSWPFLSTHRLDFSSGLRELVRDIETPEGAVAHTRLRGAEALHILSVCHPFDRAGTHVLGVEALR